MPTLYFCRVVSSIFYLSAIFFPRLISAVADRMSTILLHMMWPYCKFRTQVWNVLHAARWKYRTQKIAKNRHLGTVAQLCRAISSKRRHISTIEKKLLDSNIFPTCPHNMVNFGPLAAEIGSVVWGHPCKFQRLSRLVSVTARHLYKVADVSQTLRRWTEGATYIWQGGHHVGLWPTFLV